MPLTIVRSDPFDPPAAPAPRQPLTVVSSAPLPTAGMPEPRMVASHRTGQDEELDFQRWYAGHASRLGLDPNPDAPEHFYDYRAAFRAGAEPDADMHWPSTFKRDGHPRLVVDGVNTRTGEPAAPRSFTSAAPQGPGQAPPGRAPRTLGQVGRGQITGLERGDPERTALRMASEAPDRIARSIAAGFEDFEGGVWGFIGGLAENVGLQTVADYYRSYAQQAEQTGEAIAPSPRGLGFGESAAYGGVRSIGGSAPSLAAGAVGGPAVSLALMGATTAGRSYEEARKQGLSPRKAAIYGAVDGIVEAATERIPATRLLDDVLKGTGLTKTVLAQLREELPNEQIATLAQDLNAWAMLPENADKPFAAYVAERPTAAAQTFIATLTATVGQSAGAVAAERVMRGRSGAQRTLDLIVDEATTKADAVEAAVLAEETSRRREAAPPPVSVPTPEPVAEPPAPAAGLAPAQAAQLEALGYDPAALTLPEAQEVLRSGVQAAPRPAPAVALPDAMALESLIESKRAVEADPQLRRRRDEMMAASRPTVVEDVAAVQEAPRGYSSTQVDLPTIQANRIRSLGSLIPDEDLAQDGREAEPHVTVQYGIDSDDVSPIREAVAGVGPVEVTLGGLSLFENEDADVVKVDIEGEGLTKVRAAIREAVDAPGDTHPTYVPHATVAYVQPGKGKETIQRLKTHWRRGSKVTLDALTFSTRDGQAVTVPLTGAAIDTAALQDEADALDAVAEAERTAGVSPTATVETVQDGPTTENASGESAASTEALSRQEGMQARGESFVVYDRAGRRRPLTGPEAVDYQTKAGETYGVQGPDGFRLLEDRGGKVPPVTKRAPGTVTLVSKSLQTGAETEIDVPGRSAEDIADEVMSRLEREATPPPQAASDPFPPPASKTEGVSVRRNTARNSTEVFFKTKPEASVLEAIKKAGFRFTKVGGPHWYSTKPNAWEVAHRVTGQAMPAKSTASTEIVVDRRAGTVVERRIDEEAVDRAPAPTFKVGDRAVISPGEGVTKVIEVSADGQKIRVEIDGGRPSNWINTSRASKPSTPQVPALEGMKVVLPSFATAGLSRQQPKKAPDLGYHVDDKVDYRGELHHVVTVSSTNPKMLGIRGRGPDARVREVHSDHVSPWRQPQDTPAADSKRAALAEKRAKARAEIDAAAADLRTALKKHSSTLASGMPVPPKEVVVQTVKLVQAYAKAGIVEVDEGWLAFREDMAEWADRAKRAFEIAWEIVHGAAADATRDSGEVDRDEPVVGAEPEDGRAPDAATGERRSGLRPDQRGRRAAGDESGPSERTRVRRREPASADEGRETRPAAGEPGPVATEGNSPSNYRIAPDEKLAVGGSVTRFKNNLTAIRLAKQIQRENRPATAAEQAILVKFVGWGGLKRELSDAQHDLIADGTLTEAEYHRAFQSTLNAHYTSPDIIRTMWQAVGDLGFRRGRVLEPSMGTGHFFGLAPADLGETSLYGVELDPLTALIAQQLYPKSKIQATGVQDASLPDDYFDIAISNVPFGNYKVADPASKIPKFVRGAIHNYFFAKALQKVRPGGIVAFVTTHGTLDAETSKDTRAYLGERADFLGAVRLPDTTFKENASTEVVTDIILMRRRLPGEAPRHAFAGWTDTTRAFRTDGYPRGVPVSAYFQAHPEQVIGTMGAEGTMYGGGGAELSVKYDGKDVPARAAEALRRLTDQAIAAGQGYTAVSDAPRATKPAEVAPDAVLEQMFYLDESGDLRQRSNGLGVEPTLPGVGDRSAKILRAYLPVRDAYRGLVATMRATDTTDKDVAKARLPLTKAYDAFVKKFGPLHKAANAKLVTKDPFGPAVLAIEGWNADTETASKAAIFEKRTIMADVRPTSAASPSEALLVSLSETGGIDWPRIAELLSMTVDQAKAALVAAGRVFETPGGHFETSERYLSGRVRDKLAIARDAASVDEKYQRNVVALEAVQPADLPESRITVNLGAPWVPVDIVNAFLKHLGGGTLTAHYRPVTAEWGLTERGWSAQSSRQWETPGANLALLMHHTLNNQQVVLRDREGVVLEKATVEAQGQQAAIRKEFQRWAFEDSERADTMVRSYNDTHNATVLATYDGSHLTLPGMADAWRSMLRPHQLNAIWRAVLEGNTYLAHTMGAGKTVVLSAIAMEYKRLGLARKPIIVIPKQTLTDYARFAEFYPNARVLIGTKESTSGANRKEFMARIATGDWDAIIVTRDAMKRMPAGPKAWEAFLTEQLTELREAAAEENVEQVSTGGRRQLSDLAKKIERLEAQLTETQKKLEGAADQGLAWEDLGVDMILADEAHAYRKLMLSTNLEQVAGIPVGPGSGLTNDLYIKARMIEQATPGRGLVMATGTPLVNSVAELYVLQKFMQPQALRMAGVDKFDAWAATFGTIVTKYEADVTGTKLKLKRRFAEFANMNGLIQMFRSVVDVMLPEDLNLPTPPVTGGEADIVAVDAGPELPKFMQALAKRVENLDPKDRKTDNMLLISGDGLKAALDLRIVGRPEGGAKLDAVTERVVAKYKQWEKRRGTQLIFLELGVPGGQTWPVYDHLKAALVAKGIPANHVAFISDGNTDARRDALMQKMRTGEIRVMIGPRSTMGTGVNVQHRLVAMHHVDPHWLPALIDQADGRGIRQGNRFFMEDSPERIEGFSMDITHYVTKNSFDAYMWNAVARKGYMINQALRGNLSLDRIEEIGGGAVFDAAEVAAIASNNPLLLERATLEREIQSLQMLADAHNRKQRDRKNDVARLPGAIEAQQAELATLRAYAEKVPSAAFQIGGQAVDLEAADKAIRERFGKVDTPADVEQLGGHITTNAWNGFDSAVKVGTFLGETFGVRFRVTFNDKARELQLDSSSTVVETPRKIVGVSGTKVEPATRLKAHLEYQAREWVTAVEHQIATDEARLADAKKHAETPFADQEDLDRKKARLAAIEAEMGKNESVAAPADEGVEDTKFSDDEDDDPDPGPGKVKASKGDAVGTFTPVRISPGPPVTLPAGQTLTPSSAAMTKIRAASLPEMVEFARAILGAPPTVVRRFRNRMKTGEFRHGSIAVSADMFDPANANQLAALLAHEIGHAIDWMPDRVDTRGNILGHLRTLRRFLKHSYTDASGAKVTRREILEELKAVSAAWRPWPKNGSASYERYRNSPDELYADAVSVLFNDPAALEKVAPVFFREFFAQIDQKPNVQRAYLELLEAMSGTPEELSARRRARVDRMFEAGDVKAIDVAVQRQQERKAARQNLSLRLRIDYVDKNTSVLDKVRAAKQRGQVVAIDADPTYLLEEREHVGALGKALVEESFQPVQHALHEAGVSWRDFGAALLYTRIIAGDRSSVANPGGLSVEEARQDYDQMREPMTAAQRRVLDEQMEAFRDALKGVATDAYQAGLYKKDLYDKMMDNPAYGTFQVIEHMAERVSSAVYQSVGTLKDVRNVADASMLKAIVTIKAAKHNEITRKTLEWLQKHAPESVQAAEYGFDQGRQAMVAKPPKDHRLTLVTYKVGGATRGAYVDPYIAKAFERGSVGYLQAVLQGLQWANSSYFRPVFTTMNLGFMTFNLGRDFLRFWKATPEMTLRRAVVRYVQAVPMSAARAKVFGYRGGAVTQAQRAAALQVIEAEKSLILDVTFADMMGQDATGASGPDQIMREAGVQTYDAERSRLRKTLDWVRDLGDFIETLPKAAAIIELTSDGRSISELSADERSFIRRKVGSPDFKQRGANTQWTNNLLLFSNAIIQGTRADLETATDPVTRGGYWFKTVAVNILPKLVAAGAIWAAMAGGDDEDDDPATARIKAFGRVLAQQSEYNLTNYLILPLWLDEHGKGVAIRAPQDDFGRLIGGLTWKLLHLGDSDRPTFEAISGVLDYTAGQAPGMMPLLAAGRDTVNMLAGQNVYDAFRGRLIFSPQEMDANDHRKWLKFVSYEFQQLGGSIVYRAGVRRDGETQSSLERFVGAPVVSNTVGRFLVVSERGTQERMQRAERVVRQERSRKSLDESEAVSNAVAMLAKAPPPERSTRAIMEVAVATARRIYVDAPSDEVKRQANDIAKKIRMGLVRGAADPYVDRLTSQVPNAQKVAVVEQAKRDLGAKFPAWLLAAEREGVVTPALRKLMAEKGLR